MEILKISFLGRDRLFSFFRDLLIKFSGIDDEPFMGFFGDFGDTVGGDI